MYKEHSRDFRFVTCEWHTCLVSVVPLIITSCFVFFKMPFFLDRKYSSTYQYSKSIYLLPAKNVLFVVFSFLRPAVCSVSVSQLGSLQSCSSTDQIVMTKAGHPTLTLTRLQLEKSLGTPSGRLFRLECPVDGVTTNLLKGTSIYFKLSNF